MPEQIEVAAGLIRRGRLFLAAKRPAGAPFAGCWELPGGKLEKFETPADALGRELREELGVRVLSCREIGETCHSYPELRVRLHFFEVDEFAGEPAPKEGQSIRWLTPEDAQNLPFLPADREFLAALAVGVQFCQNKRGA